MFDEDGTPPEDEWEKVSELLSGRRNIIRVASPRGRFLRDAVLALSNPDVDPEIVSVYRRLIEEWDRVADARTRRP